MKNIYWTIKFDNGWLWNRTFYLRRDAIADYLDSYKNGTWADKDWAWHKRHDKVSVVKVRLVEID